MFTNKKIMLICTTDNMIWQFLLPHIKYLQENGNIVECVCSRTGFWFDELKEKYNLTMHEIKFERNPINRTNLRGYKTLKKLQEKEKFDLIYCQQPVGGLMGRLIAKKYKLPCIYTAHGFHFYKGCSFINKLVYKPVEKYLAKYTTALITINDEDYNACKNWKAKHIYKINGIGYNPDRFVGEKLSREDARKQLELKDEFVILTVAEFIKRKNYETMIKTVEHLKDKNIVFLSCGTGRDKEEIEKLVKELNIESKVRLLGYRKDIHNIMTASDCFFLPSHQEGLTLSIIEALHYGLPIVTSNVRGNKDLVENGVGGFVCEQNDDKEFANAIETLMTNSELRTKMSKHNLTIAPEYDLENVKRQLAKIYKEI